MDRVTRKVEVTQIDIAGGCRLDSDNCPVQRALVRTFPEFDSVVVHEKDILLTYKGWSRSEYTPEAVEQWIRDFDHERPVEPFTFDFTVSI